MLESLSPALTSLNKANSPYTLKVVEEKDDYYLMTATHNSSKKTIATYQVAKDLSAVYHIEGNQKTVIY